MKTLELFPSLETRTVVRHTLVKNLNLKDPEGYAKLDKIADPDLIEPKGYVFVGGSRQRLSVDCMPEWELMNDFSSRLGDLMGMKILKSKQDSRVLLLGPEGMELDVRKAWEKGVPSSPRIDRMREEGLL
jgi:tRNA wybutosine-synthesizing protein 1